MVEMTYRRLYKASVWTMLAGLLWLAVIAVQTARQAALVIVPDGVGGFTTESLIGRASIVAVAFAVLFVICGVVLVLASRGGFRWLTLLTLGSCLLFAVLFSWICDTALAEFTIYRLFALPIKYVLQGGNGYGWFKFFLPAVSLVLYGVFTVLEYRVKKREE